jgi:hypothetical protein
MRRSLEQQIVEHASPERMRMLHAALQLEHRLPSEVSLPAAYRDVLHNVLEVVRTTLEASKDVGHWRAAAECWNSLASDMNSRFPLSDPLPRIEPPHPLF